MKNKNKIKGYLGGIYVILITYLLFFAFFREGTNTEVHLIPFETTYELVSAHWNRTVWWMYFSILGNLLLLFPIPYFFRLKWKGGVSFALIILVPVIIECTQYTLQVGSADIDDVIFNAIGFGCGFLLSGKKS